MAIEVRPMKCPNCPNDTYFQMTVPVDMEVDGTTGYLDPTNIRWDDTLWVTCPECAHFSEDSDFIEAAEEARRP